MNRKMTCILCPNGCKLKLELSEAKILTLHGARCPRGMEFAEQELMDPHRNIATSVLVTAGELSLVSVRLTNPVPKDKLADVLEAIRALRLEAPVSSGEVLIRNVKDLGVDVISTRSVRRNS